MMNRKIIYLINPKSGTKKKELIQKQIEKLTTVEKISFEFIHTNIEGNYDYLKEKIELEKITDVVVIGGDGTLNKVINSLRFTGVNFVIIPIGSGNGLAHAANIPMKIKSALQVVFKGDRKSVV